MKVKQLILVGSRYDAFLLRQAGFRQHGMDDNDTISRAPEFMLANKASQALDMVRMQETDMVMADLDLPDMSCFELGRKVKEIQPGLPVVVVTGKDRYAGPALAVPEIKGVDYVFIWYGSTSLLHWIVKLVEDEFTFEHERLVRKWAALMLVEDDAGFASRYIPLLFDALRRNAMELAGRDEPEGKADEWADTPNRPLLLYRRDFESAKQCFEESKEGLLGVISDLEFPRNGKLDPKAGLMLTRYVKERAPNIPIIVQSHDREIVHEVEAASAVFLWKGSNLLLAELKNLMAAHLGFGDFVFKTPKGKVIAKAHNLRDLADCISRCPEEVFENHGLNNDFSAWLFIHGELDLAWAARRLSTKEPGVREKFLSMLKARLAEKGPS
ncbi:MAG: response regulator [Deltaproteobacteria bacterium]|nr:response regulator [Deltaproteobacteria bacterium]